MWDVGPLTSGQPPAAGGGGGGGVTWAYKTNASGGGGTNVTLSAMAIGATLSSDIIVVLVTNDGGPSAVPTGVTVGGNAATPVTGASDTTGVDDMTMWWLSGVTLGATSNVVVTSSGTMFTVGAQVGIISGSATPTPSSGFAVAASFSDPFTTGAQTVPSGGIMIVGFSVGSFTGGTPTNMTVDNVFPRNSSEQIAHTALGTGATITATYSTAGNQNHGVGGVWGP